MEITVLIHRNHIELGQRRGRDFQLALPLALLMGHGLKQRIDLTDIADPQPRIQIIIGEIGVQVLSVLQAPSDTRGLIRNPHVRRFAGQFTLKNTTAGGDLGSIDLRVRALGSWTAPMLLANVVISFEVG
jgi:hypothetical protein